MEIREGVPCPGCEQPMSVVRRSGYGWIYHGQECFNDECRHRTRRETA